MNSELVVLVTWLRKEDMVLNKSAVVLNRDSKLGQNYMYWGEPEIAKRWLALFNYDEEVQILAVEELTDIR